MGRLPAGALEPGLEASLVTAADKFGDRRLGSAIGLRAAEGGLTTAAALGMIHPVDLDTTELARLRAVLGRLPASVEADRLRLGVALRGGDTEAARVALGSLGLRGDAAEAALYRGRLAWEAGDLTAAADEFERAGDRAGFEQARVLMAAGKPEKAKTAVDKARQAVEAFNKATKDRMRLADSADIFGDGDGDGNGDEDGDGDEDGGLVDPTAGAESPVEKARAAVAAFAAKQASQISLIAQADIAAGGGDPEAAVEALRLAEQASPGARETQERLAINLDLTGDKAGAAAARSAAGALTLSPGASSTAARPGVGGPGGTDGSAAGPAVVEKPKAPAGDPVAPLLASRLRKMLANLDTRLLAGQPVAITPGVVPSPGFFALRQVDPDELADGLIQVLRGEPYQADVVGRSSTAVPRELGPIQAVAQRTGARVVVVYELTRASGTDVDIALVVVDTGNPDPSTNTKLVTATIDGAEHDLLGWNPRVLVVVVGVGAALLLVLGFFVIRGSAEVIVQVKSDPDARDEVLAVELSRSSSRPRISNPAAFRKNAQREGQKLRRRSGSLIGPRTKLRAFPGTWYVHLTGVYDRSNELQQLDESYSREITLKRGQSLPVLFDLAPEHAEIRVRVHDAQLAGIRVWLDGDTAATQKTNAQGMVTFQAAPGEHVLHVAAADIEVERPLTIAVAKIEAIEVNLTRERKLAEVSGGQSLMRSALSTPAAASAAHAVTFGDSAASGVGATMAMPGTSPALSSDLGARGPVSAPGMAPSAAAPAVPIGQPGSMLCGRYRILRTLGQGAMGIVYHAHDTNLEREVAIKALESSLKSHPDALRFFIEEAKALAQLHHPNIVSVFDQTTDAGEQYLVMEFVKGKTLEDIIMDRGTLPLGEALDITDQLCAGLAYAHGRRVIHRDIKPANIFVSDEGVVKLGDFGLARVMRELSIRKTEIRGTPLYMAPEQITGTNVSAKSDLYAVGGTLFTMLCGRPPFVDGDPLPPAPHAAAGAVDPGAGRARRARRADGQAAREGPRRAHRVGPGDPRLDRDDRALATMAARAVARSPRSAPSPWSSALTRGGGGSVAARGRRAGVPRGRRRPRARAGRGPARGAGPRRRPDRVDRSLGDRRRRGADPTTVEPGRSPAVRPRWRRLRRGPRRRGADPRARARCRRRRRHRRSAARRRSRRRHRAGRRRRRSGSLHAAVGGERGALPGVTGAGQLELRLGWGPASLAVGAAHLLARTSVDDAGAGVRADLTAAHVALHVAPLPALDAALGLELGQLEASAVGVATARQERVQWQAVTAAVATRRRLGERTAVTLGVEVAAPLNRPTFVVDDVPRFTPGPGLRLSLGLAWQIR
ncbi:MAG: serine/threonine-protein kinase [Kofleriaceae bacterium]